MFDLLITVFFAQCLAATPPAHQCLDSRPVEPACLARYSPYKTHLHLLKQAGCSAGRVCLSLRCSDGVSSACGGGWSCDVPYRSFRVSLCRRLLKQDELPVCWRTALSRQNYILLLYFHFFESNFRFSLSVYFHRQPVRPENLFKYSRLVLLWSKNP